MFEKKFERELFDNNNNSRCLYVAGYMVGYFDIDISKLFKFKGNTNHLFPYFRELESVISLCCTKARNREKFDEIFSILIENWDRKFETFVPKEREAILFAIGESDGRNKR